LLAILNPTAKYVKADWFKIAVEKPILELLCYASRKNLIDAAGLPLVLKILKFLKFFCGPKCL